MFCCTHAYQQPESWGILRLYPDLVVDSRLCQFLQPLCCRCCLLGKYLCAKAEILDQRHSRSLLSTGGLEKFSTFCFQSCCLALVRLSHSLNSTHIKTYTVCDAFTYSCVGASFLCHFLFPCLCIWIPPSFPGSAQMSPHLWNPFLFFSFLFLNLSISMQ